MMALRIVQTRSQLTRRRDQIEQAETLLAQCVQMQNEIYKKVWEANQILGLYGTEEKIDWKQDLEQVDVEALMRGRE